MRRCVEMAGLRCATGFLVVMLCLQVALRVTEAAAISNKLASQDTHSGDQKYVKERRSSRRVKETVNLMTATAPDVDKISGHKDLFIRWKHLNTESIFKLQDNSTSLAVPKNGIYFVNLKIYYKIPDGHKCKEDLYLKTDVQKYHSSYPEWIDVITGIDTMRCVDYWYQSVTLSQVVKLFKGAKLRVRVDPGIYDYIIKDSSTYFSVTLL